VCTRENARIKWQQHGEWFATMGRNQKKSDKNRFSVSIVLKCVQDHGKNKEKNHDENFWFWGSKTRF
jgi:hypothetical protein